MRMSDSRLAEVSAQTSARVGGRHWAPHEEVLIGVGVAIGIGVEKEIAMALGHEKMDGHRAIPRVQVLAIARA